MAQLQWDELFEDFIGTPKSASTRQTYRRRIQDFTEWCNRNAIEPLEATTEQVRRYLTVHLLDERGLAPRTVDLHLFSLSGLYGFAVEKDAIRQSPLSRRVVRRFSPRDRPVKAVSRESARRLLQAVRDAEPREKAMVRLLAVCGIWPEEVQAMDVTDVSLGASEPFVRVPNRQVLLDEETAEALEATTTGRTHGPAFLNQQGNRLTRQNLRDMLRRLARQAGIDEHVTARQLRHTAIATAIAEGAAFEAIQAAVRLKDPRNHLQLADRYRSWIPPAVLVAAALAPAEDESRSLLVQAERLASDEGIHPAAAIVLAVATLERVLRALAIQEGVPLPQDEDKVTIEMLAGPLRGKGMISARAKKEIDALADPRNAAAHGRFDRVDRKDAIHLVRKVKDLLPRLQKKLVDPVPSTG